MCMWANTICQWTVKKIQCVVVNEIEDVDSRMYWKKILQKWSLASEEASMTVDSWFAMCSGRGPCLALVDFKYETFGKMILWQDVNFLYVKSFLYRIVECYIRIHKGDKGSIPISDNLVFVSEWEGGVCKMDKYASENVKVTCG